jgi:hypothetical protein
MATKQSTKKLLVNHWRNKGEIKNCRIKWKWKYNLPEPMNTMRAILTGKFIAMSEYMFKKTQTSHVNTKRHSYK